MNNTPREVRQIVEERQTSLQREIESLKVKLNDSKRRLAQQAAEIDELDSEAAAIADWLRRNP